MSHAHAVSQCGSTDQARYAKRWHHLPGQWPLQGSNSWWAEGGHKVGVRV